MVTRKDYDVPGTFIAGMMCGKTVEMKTFDIYDPLEKDRFDRRVREHIEDCRVCGGDSPMR